MNDAARQELLLNMLVKEDMSADFYASAAIANLSKGLHVEASNRRLVRTAEWFEHPHPSGRDLQGEPDFAAIKLVRALYQFGGTTLLEARTEQAMAEFFLQSQFESKYKSENHMLLFHASRYLAAQKYPGQWFAAYGKTGEELLGEDGAFLHRFLVFRARRGWAEFDSCCYLAPVMECLLCLYDFSCNGKLKQLAGMMLDVLMLDMVCDSLDGLYGGAHGRIYGHHALDHARGAVFPLYYLYFGHSYGSALRSNCLIDALLSAYRPHAVVREIAGGRTLPYTHRESKHLHSITCEPPHVQLPQEEGSINKYTYVTPRYVMGAVNYQDPYRAGSEASWYAHHQQHQWDLTLAGGTDWKIFSHHPGHSGTEGSEHGYWTGDLGCGCGQFFGERNVVMAMYRIPAEQEFAWIHLHVPRAVFDEVTEAGNYLFLHKEGTYVSLYLHNGYEWTEEGEYAGRELICRGAVHAVICEAGIQEDFGSFAAFCEAVQKNEIGFDPAAMSLSYVSAQAGQLHMDGSGRTLNGRRVAFPYPTYDGPYMQSAYDSGVITAGINGKRLIYDFNRVSVTGEYR
ncbi:MAG: hypothetical protein K0R57_3497 [Paenibacillaceae bacterium]|jgi:hypothetical protein|nr:hypothetical protein [Paenibacillaceae bacterium]